MACLNYNHRTKKELRDIELVRQTISAVLDIVKVKPPIGNHSLEQRIAFAMQDSDFALKIVRAVGSETEG